MTVHNMADQVSGRGCIVIWEELSISRSKMSQVDKPVGPKDKQIVDTSYVEGRRALLRFLL
jgi:hypothetical protein